MHLVIISCTPRVIKNSNTAKIIDKFKEGFEKDGNTTETYYLSQRNRWNEIKNAFYKNDNILFAIPLFVESLPGIMLEFLETIEPKQYSEGIAKTKIGFILQGGFAEASQLRCGEKYLEKLPNFLNCECTGVLIKGNMFVVSIFEGKTRENLIKPFINMGEYYAKHVAFPNEVASEFTKPEYYSKRFILLYSLFSPIQKVLISLIAKIFGCKGSLKAKPYKKYIEEYS